MINRRAITIVLSIANLCLLVIYVSAWIRPAAQDKKTIIKRLTLAKEPVDISYKLKGHPLNATKAERAEEGTSAEEFDADQDWIKELTVKLRNKSGKTITYIQLNLHFPEVTKNGRTALQQVFLGVNPDGKAAREELKLAPNETVEIPLTEKFEDIKALVETGGKKPIGNVSKMWVEFHAALFDDGTLFEAGTFYKLNPDQKDPRKWVKIDNL